MQTPQQRHGQTQGPNVRDGVERATHDPDGVHVDAGHLGGRVPSMADLPAMKNVEKEEHNGV